MNPSGLFLKQTEWEELFPRADYNQFMADKTKLSEEARTFVNAHWLKFLVVLDQPDSSILSAIQALKKKNSPQITSLATKYEFSVLTLAVMKKKDMLIIPLLEAQADLKAKDVFGWTALHHAACITSSVIFDHLCKHKPELYAETKLGGIWKNVREMAGLPIAQPFAQPLLFREVNGSERLITPEDVERLTSLKQYRTEVLYPTEMLRELWSADFVDRPMHPALPNLIRNYLEKPPRLILGLSPLALSATHRFGVFAADDYNEIAVICEYVGRVSPRLPKQSFYKTFERNESALYRLDDLDAEEVGNISRFFNDGIPNIYLASAPNCRGRQDRGFFVTIGSIQRGEELTWDYGSSDRQLKWGKYTLLKVEKLHSYFRVNRLENLIKSRDPLALSYLTYVLNTPAALIDLTMNEITHASDWLQINRSIIFQEYMEASSQHLHIITGVIYLLIKFEEAKPSEAMRQFFLSQIGILNMFQIVEGIDDVTRWLAKAGTWEEKMQELLQRLPSYSWLNHQEFVLYQRTQKTYFSLQDLYKML